MDFDSVCLSVGSHKCDIAMAGLTITDERKESVTFTDSYYQASQKLIVKGDDTTFDDCTTADQVVAKLQSMDSSVKIGFQNGTTGQSYVESTGEDFESNAFKVTPVGYQNGALAVQDMVNGNLNYVIIDAAPAQSIADSVKRCCVIRNSKENKHLAQYPHRFGEDIAFLCEIRILLWETLNANFEICRVVPGQQR